MSSRELISDTVEFAKELSFEIDVTPGEKDTLVLSAAVRLMNQHLWATGGNVLTTLRADEAYLDVPNMQHGIEEVSQDSLDRSRIEHTVVQGLAHSFFCVRTAKLASFGLQLFEAQVLDQSHLQQKIVTPPVPKKLQSVFIPVESIDIHIEPYGPLITHRYIESPKGETHSLITSTLPFQV